MEEKKRGRPPKPEGKKTQRTIQFDNDNLEWLESRAAANDWTVSIEINRIVKKLRQSEKEQ